MWVTPHTLNSSISNFPHIQRKKGRKSNRGEGIKCQFFSLSHEIRKSVFRSSSHSQSFPLIYSDLGNARFFSDDQELTLSVESSGVGFVLSLSLLLFKRLVFESKIWIRSWHKGVTASHSLQLSCKSQTKREKRRCRMSQHKKDGWVVMTN